MCVSAVQYSESFDFQHEVSSFSCISQPNAHQAMQAGGGCVRAAQFVLTPLAPNQFFFPSLYRDDLNCVNVGEKRRGRHNSMKRGGI